jgi:hypothetical protein
LNPQVRPPSAIKQSTLKGEEEEQKKEARVKEDR